MGSEPPRLPPYPNELMSALKRQAALAYLVQARLPAWRARQLWARWCRYVNVAPLREDYHQLEDAAPSDTD